MKAAKAAIKSATSTNDNNNNGNTTSNNDNDKEEKEEEEEEEPVIRTSKGKRKVAAVPISRRSKRVKPVVTPTTSIPVVSTFTRDCFNEVMVLL